MLLCDLHAIVLAVSAQLQTTTHPAMRRLSRCSQEQTDRWKAAVCCKVMADPPFAV